MRAVGTLVPATNPANAAGWLTALLTADLGDWTTEGLAGGCYFAIWMVNGFTGQILKLDMDGKVLAAMGKPGDGPGEFGEAHSSDENHPPTDLTICASEARSTTRR